MYFAGSLRSTHRLQHFGVCGVSSQTILVVPQAKRFSNEKRRLRRTVENLNKSAGLQGIKMGIVLEIICIRDALRFWCISGCGNCHYRRRRLRHSACIKPGKSTLKKSTIQACNTCRYNWLYAQKQRTWILSQGIAPHCVEAATSE